MLQLGAAVAMMRERKNQIKRWEEVAIELDVESKLKAVAGHAT